MVTLFRSIDVVTSPEGCAGGATEASVTEAVTRSPVREVRSPFTVATA